MDLYLGKGKRESLDINNNQGVVRIMSGRERITKTYCSFFAVLEELEEDSSDKVKVEIHYLMENVLLHGHHN